MSILIFSCGRSGTNLLLEIMRKSKELKSTLVVEDKDIFSKNFQNKLYDNYLSKSDTHYARDYDKVKYVMDNNPKLKILWTIRDPKDMILSKMYRGQKGVDGNYETADDATPKGCVEDIEHMYNLYQFMNENYSDRVLLVKMEDIILDFSKTIKNVCIFVGIDYSDEMNNFTYRNKYKSNRYNGLDSKQVGLWKNRYSIYSNFFSKKDYKIEDVALNLNYITKFYNYEEFNNS